VPRKVFFCVPRDDKVAAVAARGELTLCKGQGRVRLSFRRRKEKKKREEEKRRRKGGPL
jgi:hypothetical protein